MAKEETNPWFKWFPDDWKADDELRHCSLAARGLAVEMLNIMHKSPRRGLLLQPCGDPYDAATLALQIAAPAETVEALLVEIRKHRVFSDSTDGVLFSRRMVRESRRSSSASRSVSARRRKGSSSDEVLRSGQQNGYEEAYEKPTNASAFSKNMSSESLRSEISEPLSSEDSPDPEGVQGEPESATLELLPPEPEPGPREASGFPRVSAHYRGLHSKARPGEKERRLYAARRKEGYSDEDLCLAIDGCHQSPFHAGENERRQKYQSLELIFRDSSQVAKFIELAQTGPPPPVSEREMRSHRAKEAFLAMCREREGEASGDEPEAA